MCQSLSCVDFAETSCIFQPADEHRSPLPIRMPDSLSDIAAQLERFARERDWSQFHSPKNLASALIVEAGELLEHFQWMTESDSRSLSAEKRAAVSTEVADVLLYLVQLSSALGIDPIAAANDKIKVNEQKYPADLSRGHSKKYTEL